MQVRTMAGFGLAFLVMGCSDPASVTGESVPPSPTAMSQLIQCNADTRAKTIACGSAANESPRSSIIIGGQHVYLELTSSNVTYANDVFGFDVTLKNLTVQGLGSTSFYIIGNPAAHDVFFHDLPVATGGSGVIDFINPADGVSCFCNGFGTYTGANQPYFRILSSILQQNQSAGPVPFKIHVPATVTSFTFTVYVSTSLRYPTGWIDLVQTPTYLAPGATLSLSPTAYYWHGGASAGAVTWSTSDAAIATVDVNGMVTAVAPGAAVITATADGPIGTRRFEVGAMFTPGSLTTNYAVSCALTPGGKAYCWGLHIDGGRFGGFSTITSSDIDRPNTLRAVKTSQTFTSISQAGATCGLTGSGAVYCWTELLRFDNQPSTTEYTTGIPGGLTFTTLSTPCALDAAGAAYCWSFFETINGVFSITTPTAVGGGISFASLSAGSTHHCGLTSGGAAYCWGEGGLGQLGNGGTSTSPTPVAVSGGLTFASINVGYEHTCGITNTGAAYCWGRNSTGELGVGAASGTPSSTPQLVTGGHTFSVVAAGFGATCGIAATGTYCWGDNSSGQLGDGTTTDSPGPTLVSGGHTFTSIGRGSDQTCAQKASGAVYCWGHNNFYGLLGNGVSTMSTVPVAVTGN